MRMYDIIHKKREGGELTREELRFFVLGFTRGEIPDYQASALLMAIFFRGMTRRETGDLTLEMAGSGDRVDLSALPGVKVDKHSTGGVGDKTSLIIGPIAAACGVTIAKMSGRGLGHTGGTVDKLESIPGLRTDIPRQEFFDIVKRTGLSIIGQSGNLCPADKKLYALRDVTGTVRSMPLIVSSIMSKKLAAGADVIVLDVKCGGGAFMKTEAEARELAREMVEIGKLNGRRTVACITDMDQPLGNAVGNALEVAEALALLRGEYGGDLLELCLTLGSCILTEAGAASGEAEAREKLLDSIKSGAALEKFADFVRSQGGDAREVYEPSLLPQAPVRLEVPAPSSGYVNHIDAMGVGLVSMHLGGGRATKESEIDLSVGLVLHRKLADAVEAGESLATIHARDEESARRAAEQLTAAYEIGPERPERPPFVRDIIR